jgi:predicted nucleotide-binding protein
LSRSCQKVLNANQLLINDLLETHLPAHFDKIRACDRAVEFSLQEIHPLALLDAAGGPRPCRPVVRRACAVDICVSAWLNFCASKNDLQTCKIRSSFHHRKNIMNKPSVFIGSSSEGLEFARAIRSLLNSDSEVTLWNEGFFKLGNTFIETLINSLPRFDFGVLVLTPDDLVNSKNITSLGPRDNVIFELGLFMGRLGRARTFVVHQADAAVKLPTDLAGVTTARYEWPRSGNDHEGAVGAACDSIRKAILDLGFAEGRVSKHIQIVEKEQEKQKEQIEVLSFLLGHFLPQFELEHLNHLMRNEPFMYRMHPGFEREIRHLWELHFITKTHDFKILGMPQEGDLRVFFSISDQGKMYIKFREQYETKIQADSGRAKLS